MLHPAVSKTFDTSLSLKNSPVARVSWREISVDDTKPQIRFKFLAAEAQAQYLLASLQKKDIKAEMNGYSDNAVDFQRKAYVIDVDSPSTPLRDVGKLLDLPAKVVQAIELLDRKRVLGNKTTFVSAISTTGSRDGSLR
jgi:hypothetical protein